MASSRLTCYDEFGNLRAHLCLQPVNFVTLAHPVKLTETGNLEADRLT